MLIITAGGEHHHWNLQQLRCLATSAEKLKAIHIGHFNVTNYQRYRRSLLQLFDRFPSIPCLQDSHTDSFQGESERSPQSDSIIDNQYRRSLGSFDGRLCLAICLAK